MVRVGVTLVLLCFVAVGCAVAVEIDGDLVLWYDFSEGAGTVLRDKSGGGNDGIIHGGEFVPAEKGYALRFDGEDDYVDCGESASLDLRGAMTLETWIRPDGDSPFGCDYQGVVGKGHSSFFLMHRCNDYLYWGVSGGGNSVRISVANEVWLHIAGVFDGAALVLYVNGDPAGTVTSKEPIVHGGGRFYLGRTSEESRWTNDSRYKGQMALLRVYRRALSGEEVKAGYEQSKAKVFRRALRIRPYVFYHDGQIALEVDASGLGEVAGGAYAELNLSPRNGGAGVLRQRVGLDLSAKQQDVILSAESLAGGDYVIEAQAYAEDGGPLGNVARAEVNWPSEPQWPSAPEGVRIRNNFVTELVELDAAELVRRGAGAFVNPREGWVYFEAAPVDGIERLEVTVAGASATARTIALAAGAPEGRLQSMQYLDAGEYRLSMSSGDWPDVLRHLSVRTMPEIILTERGPVLRERYPAEVDILLNEVNVTMENFQRHAQEDKMLTEDIGSQRDWLAKWRESGRRAITHCKATGWDGTGHTGVDESQCYEFWTNSAGLVHLDGIIIDEFGYGTKDSYPHWIEAVKRLRANRKYADQKFYGYSAGANWAMSREAKEFQFAIRDTGYYFAPEVYLSEQRTKLAAQKHICRGIRQDMLRWSQAIPDSLEQVVMVLGCCSKNSYNMNTWPNADYRVFYDMQMNLLANDPMFFNMRGVTGWVMRYADPENLRWMARLYRHYCIEGKRNLLSDEVGLTYELDYIRNADFVEGLAGWDVQVGGKVTADEITGYGAARDFWKVEHGDAFCLMERGDEAANVVSQTMRDLVPGALYSVKLVSCDFNDLRAGAPVRRKHQLTVTVDGGVMLDEYDEQVVYQTYHNLPPYMAEACPWFNRHFRVFRAEAGSGTLKISDWVTHDDPGAGDGQAVMFNFVEVQRYLQP